MGGKKQILIVTVHKPKTQYLFYACKICLKDPKAMASLG